jgi:leucyl-tRNA synthetase
MSSSKGNVFLLEDAVQEFGADTVRMFLVGSAEPWQDFDWRNELVSSTRKQIERFWNTVIESSQADEADTEIDKWLVSRLQHHIGKTTESLMKFQTRQALQEAFFGVEADLKWYRRRLPDVSKGHSSLKELCSVWIRLMAPIIPFTTEQLWSETGEMGLASFADWPEVDDSRMYPEIELAEELLLRTVEDIESIMKLIQITPSSLTLCIAPGWKHEVFRTIALSGDRSQVIKEIMKDEKMRMHGKDATDAVKQCTTLIHRLPPQIVEALSKGGLDEEKIFKRATSFLEKEFGIPVTVVPADPGTYSKAAAALPFKPAILIE